MLRALLILLLSTPLLLDASPAMAKKKPSQPPAEAKEAAPETPWEASTFAGLELRNIGPALTSGRISDLAVHPDNPSIIYVAVASGGVWKTVNRGVTWQPIFDHQGSYSIGCLTLDPNNPNVLWVGTGENNSQRSVGYGDGVYRSTDGGASFTHMGLETSEHIGRIVVDPRDSQVVYVASQGPLWSSGGERGLYKTVDGGANWERVLHISEDTGVSEVLMDPRNPDLLYAVAYQRRRHVWTLINGGPEAGIHKSIDGGTTWTKLANGLPSGDVGRIGMAISPVAPDTVYAIVEGKAKDQGFYRSTNRGASWHKMSDYSSGSAQYYQELFADPVHVDRVYSMDTWMQVTDDGGATWRQVGERSKHVDNHALWIDPYDTDHLLAGCDGGLYETWDRGANWMFHTNLPLVQFYRIAVSNDQPFYNVYGGTQDNFTLGGPSRTTTGHGIRNSDWFVTLGGDGFQPQVDPENPDIIYSQWQYGNLVRYDRKSGEIVDIQPQAAAGEAPLVWNWDAALALSPHASQTLYFGADRLYRTDDRGDSWRVISPDLTRDVDRMQQAVMGKVWPIDAVARNRSTSIYGNIVTVSESPQAAGLLYVGTDDGLIQVSEDGGENWRRVDDFPGVPRFTYVQRVRASRHQADTVFAAWNAHKNGDFKPYLMKSTDRGSTWTSITGDLPERGSIYAVEQDPEVADLLFAGTEFGAYFSRDGGNRWIKLAGGMPTIAIRDLVIHPQADDLVLGSFGRGIFILDDMTPLRSVDDAILEQAAASFTVEDALAYHPSLPLGLRDKSFQGDNFFISPNPAFGAIFTYYLKDNYETLAEEREARQADADPEDQTAHIPSWDELRAEAREQKPQMILTVRDDAGAVVRRLTAPATRGIHRTAWDLRWPDPEPISLEPVVISNPFEDAPAGPPAMPGTYSVSFELHSRDGVKTVAEPQTFQVVTLGNATLPTADVQATADFHAEVAALQRAVSGTGSALGEATTRVTFVEQAILQTPAADPTWQADVERLRNELEAISTALYGDAIVARAQEPTARGIAQRLGRVSGFAWNTSSAPTQTQIDQYKLAADDFAPVLDKLRTVLEIDLPALETKLEAAGAGWTPGRVPHWDAATGR